MRLLRSMTSLTPILFLLFFFFLMIRRPPRSTLFPYTRSSDLRGTLFLPEARGWPRRRKHRPTRRSEEHTSELQSRENLVCRLLLEKKKNTRGLDNVGLKFKCTNAHGSDYPTSCTYSVLSQKSA